MKNELPSPATQDGADPSMEEILASIRRILNDDDVPAEPPAVAEPAADDNVLLLDQSMMVSRGENEPDVADRQAAEPEIKIPAPIASEPMAALPEAEPPHHEMEVLTPTSHADSSEQQIPELVAPEAAAAAASSVGSLVRTLAAGRATQVYAGGPTLEDLVRAELRPLLKEWLDANLPPMVERLVRAEIERVVGRGIS
jgi:hypothetical protein